MTSSKAGKIVRRTLMGSALVATLAITLWLLSSSPDGKVLFYTVCVVLAVGVIEVTRLGRFAEWDLTPALASSALGSVLLLGAVIRDQALVREQYAPYGLHELSDRPSLAAGYAWAGALALASLSLVSVTQRVMAAMRAPVSSHHRRAWIPRGVTYLAMGCVIAFVTMDWFEAGSRVWFAVLLLVIVTVTSIPLVAREPGGAARMAWATGLALWLIPPLCALWSLWDAWGIRPLIAFLLLAKIGDTAGYYVGSALGRTHPFPTISPGKTTAGCVGSFVAAAALGGMLSATGMLPPAAWGVGAGLVAGATTNLAAQAGDLLESWIKRRAGVKDSSPLFGPSGGMLDQIDSLLLAVPVCCVIWPWLFGVDA